MTLFKQQLNRIAHYSCKKNLRTMIIISTLQAVSICSDMRKSWWHPKCALVIEPPLVPEPMRNGVLKSVGDEEQRIKQWNRWRKRPAGMWLCMQPLTRYQVNLRSNAHSKKLYCLIQLRTFLTWISLFQRVLCSLSRMAHFIRTEV